MELDQNSTDTEKLDPTPVVDKTNSENVSPPLVPSVSTSGNSDLRTSVMNLWGFILTWKPNRQSHYIVTRIAIPLLTWAILYLMLGNIALPGEKGLVFSLCIIIFIGLAFGELFSVFKLPPLLGMLILGITIRNVPKIDVGSAITSYVSSTLRQIALVVILIRAGLGLDPKALMRLKGVVIRLAFCPCIAEAITVAIASHFILDFPWLWGLMLGFVLAAVSPAVIVPSLLSLREGGYGVAKGIPTIIIAASSVDDILAISAFGLVLGLNFSKSESIIHFIIQGPLELILGVGFGIFWGLFIGIFFSEEDSDHGNSLIVRIILTLGGGCLSVFGFQEIGYPGSGALGCLTATFVAGVFWRKKGVLSDNNNLTESFGMLWYIFQTLLFGLIGCEINLAELDPAIAALGVLCLGIGLFIRLIVTYLTVANSGLTVKERIFVAIAWVPKATVQAAIGPIALDTARSLNAGNQAEQWGIQILTISVLVILITAPIGATAVMTLGPKLLSTNKNKTELNVELESGKITHANGDKSLEDLERTESEPFNLKN